MEQSLDVQKSKYIMQSGSSLAGPQNSKGLIYLVVVVIVIVIVAGFLLLRNKGQINSIFEDSSISSTVRQDIQIKSTTTAQIQPIQAPKPIIDVSAPNYDIFGVSSGSTQKAGSKEISGLVCKNASQGSFVTSIKSRAGNYLDALSIDCSDDKTNYDFVGGSGGETSSIISSSRGFQKLKTKSGLHIDSLEAYGPNNNLLGKVGGTGGSFVAPLDCGQGANLVGFTGSYDNYITTLDAVCSRIHDYQ